MADSLADLNLSQVVLAIGSLGTAAYGVVDATKAFGGGISNRGFGDIRSVLARFILPASLPSVLSTLRANWLNGMPLADQKAVAKALVKLNLTEASAIAMAGAAGVDVPTLRSVATKLAAGGTLSQPETDVYGRFDLLLSSQLDQGYQRADQRYRNSAKLLAVVVSVALAVAGAWMAYPQTPVGIAILAGLLATPLAPIAKDLSSAIQAGARVAQAWKK